MSLQDFAERSKKPCRIARLLDAVGDDRVVLYEWLRDPTIASTEIRRRLLRCAEAEDRPELIVSPSTIVRWRADNGIATNGAI